MSEKELPELLGELSVVSGLITGQESDRDAKVLAARKAGASWTQIGEALGISKQSAWERYRNLEAW